MADPRGYVLPGDRLAISAAQINFLNRLMAGDTSFRAGPLNGWAFGGNVILARNDTGQDVPRWGVMRVDGVAIDPNDGETQRREFEAMPCVVGGAAYASGKTPIVAIEPIASGTIGRVAIAGAVQVKAADVDKLDGATELWKDANWALVRFGGGGGVRLGTIAATWFKGEDATVTQIKGDGTAISPTVTFTAKNWFADVTVPTGTKKVACAKVDATWILIAAEC